MTIHIYGREREFCVGKKKILYTHHTHTDIHTHTHTHTQCPGYIHLYNMTHTHTYTCIDTYTHTQTHTHTHTHTPSRDVFPCTRCDDFAELCGGEGVRQKMLFKERELLLCVGVWVGVCVCVYVCRWMGGWMDEAMGRGRQVKKMASTHT
jgi:hypothetical protein